MTRALSVYVAASSDEIDRARMAMAALRDRGITVTSTWPEVIASQSGVSNPRAATSGQRHGWAKTDLDQVDESAILWMLAPKVATGRGAYAELGFAIARGRHIVVSGDTKQSIFTAIGWEFDDDVDALEFVYQLAICPIAVHATPPDPLPELPEPDAPVRDPRGGK